MLATNGLPPLPPSNGVMYQEEVISDLTKRFKERHFAIPKSSDGERPLGPLALFSFVLQTRVDVPSSRQQAAELKVSLRSHLPDGVLLDAKEKSVMFPIVHFSEDRNSLQKRLSDEYLLDNGYLLHQGASIQIAESTQTSYSFRLLQIDDSGLGLEEQPEGLVDRISYSAVSPFPIQTHLNEEIRVDTPDVGKQFGSPQGVYREVRSICPEGELHELEKALPQHVGYIILGFKSIDRNFSQVMVNSWKDWTGARYIYMYLPDELGLTRISFYTREAPDSLNMFMYVVLVECRAVNTRERQMRLLDFAQRMRVERMSGYISVYGISQD